MIAKIYKKMYIRNLPFRVIVPVCYQMCLNVVFSGLSDNKKKQTIRLKRAESFCPLPFPSDGDRCAAPQKVDTERWKTDGK